MRVVAVCLDTIGDLVLREPLFRALVNAGHELHLAVRSPFEELVPRLSPGIHCLSTSLHPYAFADEYWPAVVELAESIDRVAPDVLVFPTFNRTPLESLLRGLIRGVPAAAYRPDGAEVEPLLLRARDAGLKVGAVSWERLVDVKEDVPEWQKHACFARTAFGIALSKVDLHPRLSPLPTDIDTAAEVVSRQSIEAGRFVLVAPLGSTSVRHKALSRPLVEAAALALERHGLRILFTGTSAEEEGTRAVAQGVADAGFWFGGHGTLGTLIGLVQASRLYFGADTGPMHIAAALDKPVAAVFGGGHWPRFLPAAERGFAVSQFVPCFGCGWDCLFDVPVCVNGIDDRRITENLEALLAGRRGFWVDGGEERLRRAGPFERMLMDRVSDLRTETAKASEWAGRSDRLLYEARQEAEAARQWARNAETECEALKKSAAELRAWAEKAELNAAAARELASSTRDWAERTELLLAQARFDAEQATAWARRADEQCEKGRTEFVETARWAKSAEQRATAAQRQADENRAWAERTEANLAEALRQAQEAAERARGADEEREQDKALLAELRQWAEDAERRVAAAQAQAQADRAWAARTELNLAEARRQAQEATAWARKADEERERGKVLQARTAQWAESAEKKAEAARRLADENRAWAERAEAMLFQARADAGSHEAWAMRADAECRRLTVLADQLSRDAAEARDALYNVERELEEARRRVADLEAEIEPLRRFARTYRWVYSLHYGRRRS